MGGKTECVLILHLMKEELMGETKNFFTILDTKFFQTWCPMMRDTTIANGTIKLKKGSYKEGIPRQTWIPIESLQLK